ncbi:MAG: YraN family protein [Actinomycetota bacterium]|nr:YraN family protein [Actinomycetota bacterium]
MRVKDAVGLLGEQLAVDFLAESGLTVLERNWRSADGEIDIIARDGAVLAFVEVKTRSSLAFGDPAEAISPAKAARYRRLAAQWLNARRSSGQRWPEVRFDVVAVVRRTPAGPSVRHIKAAF